MVFSYKSFTWYLVLSVLLSETLDCSETLEGWGERERERERERE